VPAAEIQRAVDERLTQLTESVRLPGFRPGKIPRAAMEERYGAQSRALVMKRLAADLAQRGLPAGSVASSCELLAGAESGDLEISIAATHLPDLPDVDFSKVTIEAIKLAEPDTSAETAVFLRERLKSQVLDSLDTAFAIPLFPGLIEREFSAIWKLAEARGGLPAAPEERRPLEADFRKIAERRLRLGVVLAELARRLGIRAAHIAAVEDSVIDHLLSQARVEERLVSTQELRSLMAG
jgi:FKBP-type peptidyl-prolyl cis-trans isomerase (trigger factor)